MKNQFLMLLILSSLMISCSQVKKKDRPTRDSRVTSYVNELKDSPLAPPEADYIKNYARYLDSVKQVFDENGMTKKFDIYIDSLRNNNQILAHAENSLPQKYANDKGRQANINSSDYKLYRTKTITNLHDRLNQQRSNKLRMDLGFKMYSELVRNNQEKLKRDSEGKPEYLFPL
jgi:hypothetical protein